MSVTLATALMFSQVLANDAESYKNQAGWVVATIQHSEWCPAGNVRLDIQTGDYTYTERAPQNVCNDEALERPIQKGWLRGEALNQVQAAFADASANGLEAPICRNGGKPDYFIVSNAGQKTLVLTTGAYTKSVPVKLECWSEAASALHAVLDEVFDQGRMR